MSKIARVRLRKPRRVLFFKCDDIVLQRDEACIVQTEQGQEWGTCILPPEPCSDEIAEKTEFSVLRRATTRDAKTFDSLLGEERKAREICAKKIARRDLPMKLVDVEYTFDKRKVVFYFTAEDRVDFRELVRDLAHDLRTRIELRHIQVRDEAKMVGGIGSCGRALCCASWLDEFKPISMRMAKRQNLSLNPSKISGQCGRLLCCLSYENDQYEDPRKRKKRLAQEQAAQRAAEKEKAEKEQAQKGEKEKETVQKPEAGCPHAESCPQKAAAAKQRKEPRRRGGQQRSKRATQKQDEK